MRKPTERARLEMSREAIGQPLGRLGGQKSQPGLAVVGMK
jgi:hypothetical protein